MLIKINKMEELEKIFDFALTTNNNSVAVEISIPGKPGNSEFIVTKRENIRSKLYYYQKFYNENLINNKNENIKIISAGCGDTDFWEEGNEV